MSCPLCAWLQPYLAGGCIQPLWAYVRDKVSRRAMELREQGFSGTAMLHYSELEYRGIVERMKKLDEKYKVSD